MDIVEIVTTIAHKNWNCKHFSLSFSRGLNWTTKANERSENDFISISYARIDI